MHPLAGSSFAGRAFRPVEAAEAAIATCNLGLEHVRQARSNAEGIVRRWTADGLFRIGWHVLFWEVSLAAARSLRARSTTIGGEIDSAIEQGKTWRLLRRLDVVNPPLSESDRKVFVHLLDRFPSLPDDGDVGRTPRFLATKQQVKHVRGLLRPPRKPRGPSPS